ncbi:MAG TPA: PfkB family carbohydrate kinase [Syntrophales bacterium]|jgi:1-phosphofructokinase|nr:PfkB family carbohydrate kinase [Syntrophales bacterium]
MIGTVTINPALEKLYFIEDFTVNRLHRLSEVQGVQILPGGKGVDISRLLKNVGLDSIALGLAGGNNGRVLLVELRKTGVTTGFTPTENETRTNIYILDNKNHTLTQINESGSCVDEDDIHLFMDQYERVVQQVDIMVLAGALCPGMDRGFYRELVLIAAEAGCRTFLHASPDILEASLPCGPTCILPDMRMGGLFFGHKLRSPDICILAGSEIIGRDPDIELVVFSHLVRQDGMLVAVTRNRAMIFKPDDSSYVNLFGFSNAIVAGIVYGMSHQKSFQEAMYYGCAFGYAVTREREKSSPNLDVIKSYLPKIRCCEERSL